MAKKKRLKEEDILNRVLKESKTVSKLNERLSKEIVSNRDVIGQLSKDVSLLKKLLEKDANAGNKKRSNRKANNVKIIDKSDDKPNDPISSYNPYLISRDSEAKIKELDSGIDLNKEIEALNKKYEDRIKALKKDDDAFRKLKNILEQIKLLAQLRKKAIHEDELLDLYYRLS